MEWNGKTEEGVVRGKRSERVSHNCNDHNITPMLT